MPSSPISSKKPHSTCKSFKGPSRSTETFCTRRWPPHQMSSYLQNLRSRCKAMVLTHLCRSPITSGLSPHRSLNNGRKWIAGKVLTEVQCRQQCTRWDKPSPFRCKICSATQSIQAIVSGWENASNASSTRISVGDSIACKLSEYTESDYAAEGTPTEHDY